MLRLLTGQVNKSRGVSGGSRALLLQNSFASTAPTLSLLQKKPPENRAAFPCRIDYKFRQRKLSPTPESPASGRAFPAYWDLHFGPVIPAPVIGTCRGLPGALVTIFSVAPSDISAEGLKATPIVQLCPFFGPRVPAQYKWKVKSLGFPVMLTNEIGPICTFVVPLSIRVTVCFAVFLIGHSSTLPKGILDGDAVTWAATTSNGPKAVVPNGVPSPVGPS
jgi:hypothetical protein